MQKQHIVNILLIVLCLMLLSGCGMARQTKNGYKPSREAVTSGVYDSYEIEKDLSGPHGKIKNTPYTIGGKTYTPFSVEAAKSYSQTGLASWYGSEMYKKGGSTANGEKFDENAMTAAHCLLPLPVYVKVTNLENGKWVVVRVNDRGPFKSDRVIDVSRAAAEELGFVKQGSAKVLVEFIGYNK